LDFFGTISGTDTLIIGAYLLLCIIIGVYAGGRPGDAVSYFRTSGDVPWWAASFSVVATETSLLTVISIPAVAYGGSLVFLQLVLGYICGRVLVSFLILPYYFKGILVTPYAYFEKRFGLPFRRLSAFIFLITRLLADGIRLFAAAIPLKMITGLDYQYAIAIIAFLTLAYTYWGGLRSVIWIDVLQLFVYTLCAGLIIFFAWNAVDVGVMAQLTAGNKLTFFQMPVSFVDIFVTPYNFVGAFVGGAFLSMASHGTDHIIVQRLLACGDLKNARKALISSGFFVFIQFLIFLIVGLLVYVYYSGASFIQLGLNNPDEILIHFVVNVLPTGATGLFIAALFAAAMSTLSSSLSALSSSTLYDLFPKLSTRGDALMISRFMMVVWTLIFIVFASLFTDTNNPIVELGLSIAGFTYGALLGAFLMGFYSNISTESALSTLILTVVIMTGVILYSDLAWPWYTCTGLSVYALLSWMLHLSIPAKRKPVIHED